MPLITWSDNLQMNIRVIDNDHRMLVDIINALSDSLQKGEEPTAISDHLKALSHYVEEHFAREEGFMEAAGYPQLREHMAQHQKLALTVYELIQINQEQPNQLRRPEVQAFLKTWLTDHILKNDMRYVPYLRGNMHGAPSGLHGLKAVTVRVPTDKISLIFKCAMALTAGGKEAARLE
ncbi:MAG: hypothetical protein A2521_06140, partial [Deltaproteobacteria bacterium RIFOXYD12_FULL_57_12]